MLEKKEIAKRLGISQKALNRIVYGRIRYELIENKRYYNWDEVMDLIKKGNNG